MKCPTCGIDKQKLIKDIEGFIPKLEGHTSMDVLLKVAIRKLVDESVEEEDLV